MSDYELVIKKSKHLERMLEEGFGAQGRGLHEKVSSVEGRLPGPLVKQLRFIATVRNKLVHDDKMDRLDDRRGYEDACNKAEKELALLLQPAGKKPRRWLGIAMAVGVVLAVLVWLLVAKK
jgi:hypothetical protein